MGEGGATVESTVETIVEDELGPSTLGNEVVGDADPLIIFSFLTSFLSAGLKGNTTDCSDPGASDIVWGGPGAGGSVVGDPGLGKPNANAELVIEKVELWSWSVNWNLFWQ